MDIAYCHDCLDELENCGELVKDMFLDICEVYLMTKQAVLVNVEDKHVHQVIRLLEIKNYLMTADYEDPYVLTKPSRCLIEDLGCKQCDKAYVV